MKTRRNAVKKSGDSEKVMPSCSKPESKERRSEAILFNTIPPFPIVGIGASAGGLQALEQFFKHMPSGVGIAFIIVQHLDPERKGMMVELLQRGTSMPVIQITDQMKVLPDHIYLIPPNRDLSILRGVLHLLETANPRGLRLPIDFFFHSMADDLREYAIGVILSGMGSDGADGARAIHAKSGAVFVQSPDSAKFDGMPQSTIKMGGADVVGSAIELPSRIIEYVEHYTFPEGRRDSGIMDANLGDLENVMLLLREQTGHDFSLYKNTTLYRRVAQRAEIHKIERMADYVRYMRETPKEGELLLNELLINVTSFFRDHEVWEQLSNEIIPKLLDSTHQGDTLRAWTPGCSTGEEAYSLAIVFKEAIEHFKPANHFSVQIFATDLDKDAIDKARRGIYPHSIAEDVSKERLQRFFVKTDQGYQVIKEIRETLVFAPQNLVMDPPFTKLDVVTCRNLLIYFTSELQRKVIDLFHYSLNPHGILVLGSAESIGHADTIFDPFPGKNRLFQKIHSELDAHYVSFPSRFSRHTPSGNLTSLIQTPKVAIPNIKVLMDELILSRLSPPAVFVTEQGEMVYVNGKTGKYLEAPSGNVNWNLMAMARDGLKQVLSEGFYRAVQQKKDVILNNVKVGSNGGNLMLDVHIKGITHPDALQGMVMVAFFDKPMQVVKEAGKEGKGIRSVSNARLDTLEVDLQNAREALSHCRVALQTSYEDYKSANEELQSTNEELQSANEELMTSKEELQSMNEELQTVNQELQCKLDELSYASNDMENLLNSTDIATLFLDEALNIRRFTKSATQLIKLIPGDIGRPFMDVVNVLNYPELAIDAQEVLRTLTASNKEISTLEGRYFSVRILPYRTLDNLITGVVVTFANISEYKVLEAKLRSAKVALEKRLIAQSENMDSTHLDLSIDKEKPKPDTE